MRARLLAVNHRGVEVPRTLGLWLAAAAIASTALVAWAQPGGPVGAPGWGALAATLLVFAAGFVDDLVDSGPRGIRNHLRALAEGRVSSGVLKLVVVPGAAIVAVALQPGGSTIVRIAGVVLLAGCANAWNGLDVQPGRAIKFALLAMIGLVGVPLRLLPTLPLVAFVSMCALWPDLRERAMLGDGGANLLGFTIGLGLYLVLPSWGVVVAALIAVAVNIVAETTTLSRAIEGVPPLRWFDDVGRLPRSSS
jgi:UDP-GlcNAc:undecaprenyl-phosphate GlcNAc-1-phosphate transferase